MNLCCKDAKYWLRFDNVDLMNYILNKISLNRDGSYIDSSKWLKNKKATINPKNNDDKCLQNAIAAAINKYLHFLLYFTPINSLSYFV